jgi:CRP/FNR family cyclic AMP-dependent transcriptional regulator
MLLANALKQTFLAPSNIVSLAQGEVLFSRGEKGDYVFLVLTGGIKTVNYAPDGTTVHFYEYKPDQVFGHYAIFANAPRSAAAVASTKTTVLRIPSDKFVDCVLANRDLTLELLRQLAIIARADTFRITAMLSLPSPQRVAAWLLYKRHDCDSLKIPLENREDLASQLGMTRETLSRCLSRLQKSGAIDMAPHEIILKDLELLMAESDHDDPV